VPTKPIRQFVVGKDPGDDFTPDEIQSLVLEIAFWYQSADSGRAYADPKAVALEHVQQCLLGETTDGRPWKNCPPEFANRVRSKCGWDMTAKKGIVSPRVKNKEGGRALDKRAQAAAKALGTLNPVQGQFDEVTFREQLEKDILAAYPELDNPAHLPNVRSLSLYYAQREVIDRELQLGMNSADKRLKLYDSLRRLEEMADATMKRLGIHADQLRKNIKDRVGSSVGDLAQLVDEDDEYRDLERLWSLQLALQLWWMLEHPNGNRSGPNLHPFEVWHLTRTRPVKFTCRHGETYTVVEGFTPEELYAFLTAHGVLVEEPVLPSYITPADLEGMVEHFEGQKAPEFVPHPTHEERANPPEGMRYERVTDEDGVKLPLLVGGGWKLVPKPTPQETPDAAADAPTEPNA
jgi:hypothetical protein